jgi:hypothetical protein
LPRQRRGSANYSDDAGSLWRCDDAAHRYDLRSRAGRSASDLSEACGQLPVHVYRRGEGDSKDRAPDHPAHKPLHGEANDWTPAASFAKGSLATPGCDGEPVELIRADIGKRYDAYSKAVASRILNPNEIRAMENRPACEDGNAFVNPHWVLVSAFCAAVCSDASSLMRTSTKPSGSR